MTFFSELLVSSTTHMRGVAKMFAQFITSMMGHHLWAKHVADTKFRMIFYAYILGWIDGTHGSGIIGKTHASLTRGQLGAALTAALGSISVPLVETNELAQDGTRFVDFLTTDLARRCRAGGKTDKEGNTLGKELKRFAEQEGFALTQSAPHATDAYQAAGEVTLSLLGDFIPLFFLDLAGQAICARLGLPMLGAFVYASQSGTLTKAAESIQSIADRLADESATNRQGEPFYGSDMNLPMLLDIMSESRRRADGVSTKYADDAGDYIVEAIEQITKRSIEGCGKGRAVAIASLKQLMVKAVHSLATKLSERG